jgi:hypothetical protein
MKILDTIKSIEDIKKFDGIAYTQKLQSFYDWFNKTYEDEQVIVHPIVFTAFQIIGASTNQLVVDPYMV